MWIGLIISLVVLIPIVIWTIYGIVNIYEPENKVYRENEYRFRIKGEQPDDYCYDGRPCYNTRISKENLKDFLKYKDAENKKCKIKKSAFVSGAILIALAVLCGCGWFGAFIENEKVSREIEEYKASKYTIETSLNNANLTGLERIELVKQASDNNSWLAQKQYEVKQWYRFYLDKDIILKLEFIDLEKGE